MKYIVTINGKNYEVEVEKGEAVVVGTGDSVAAPMNPSYTVETEKAVNNPVPANTASKQSVAGEPVKAPMPGTILDVKARPGATVKKGEVLVILEAMKMENEITAPRDGIILQITASKGAPVNTGDTLVVLQA